MRKIPDHIHDPKTKEKLQALDQKIDTLMKKVDAVRARAKKEGFNAGIIEELKKIGEEINTHDSEWKKLTQP